jgi:hypothetical protein
MTADLVGALITAAITLALGVYAALLGYRVIGPKPGADEKHDRWSERYGQLFRFVGPVLIAVGVVLGIVAFVRYPLTGTFGG